MFEAFAHRLAAGLALALFAVPPQLVAPRFFRIQFVIILGIGVGAAVLAWDAAHGDAYWLATGIALGAALVGPLCWVPEGGIGQVCLGTIAAGMLVAIPLPAGTAPTVAGAAAIVLSSALLGLATTSMLLGHWYLIAPTMSIRPLLLLLDALLITCALRLATASWELSVMPGSLAALDSLSWLWLLTRWGAGLVGVTVLAWMARQASRMRATQAATGILYVVTIFAFMGELSDLLLLESLSRNVA